MGELTEMLELVPAIRGGNIAAGGTGVMLAVRIYRALGGPWPTKPWIGKIIVGVLSLTSALLIGFLVGGPAGGVAAIIMEAVGVAFTAVTGHKLTQGIGAAVREPVPYQPSPFRDAGSVLIPPPVASEIISRRRAEKAKEDG